MSSPAIRKPRRGATPGSRSTGLPGAKPQARWFVSPGSPCDALGLRPFWPPREPSRPLTTGLTLLSRCCPLGTASPHPKTGPSTFTSLCSGGSLAVTTLVPILRSGTSTEHQPTTTLRQHRASGGVARSRAVCEIQNLSTELFTFPHDRYRSSPKRSPSCPQNDPWRRHPGRPLPLPRPALAPSGYLRLCQFEVE